MHHVSFVCCRAYFWSYCIICNQLLCEILRTHKSELYDETVLARLFCAPRLLLPRTTAPPHATVRVVCRCVGIRQMPVGSIYVTASDIGVRAPRRHTSNVRPVARAVDSLAHGFAIRNHQYNGYVWFE